MEHFTLRRCTSGDTADITLASHHRHLQANITEVHLRRPGILVAGSDKTGCISHLSAAQMLFMLQSVSTADSLNFIRGRMFRWEVTDSKALIYADVFSCTRSPFLHSSQCCLTAVPHRRLHGQYDCAKSLHLNRVWQLGGCRRRVVFIRRRPLPPLFILVSLFWLSTHANDIGKTGTCVRLCADWGPVKGGRFNLSLKLLLHNPFTLHCLHCSVLFTASMPPDGGWDGLPYSPPSPRLCCYCTVNLILLLPM